MIEPGHCDRVSSEIVELNDAMRGDTASPMAVTIASAEARKKRNELVIE